MDEDKRASEALYVFAAWLTAREKPVTFSAKHESSIAAELVNEFCEVNKLEKPRGNFTDHWEMPK